MKFGLTSTALGATAIVALAADAYVVPSGGSAFPKAPSSLKRSAMRNGGSVRMPLTRKRNIAVDEGDVLAFAQRQKGYVENKFATREERIAKRQIQGLTGIGPDTFYVAEVSVGTPVQTFQLILDTGSSDTWIASTGCNQTECTDVAVYDASASTTAISSTTAFQITYGSGAASGLLYADTVSLAGYTVFNTTVADATTLDANTISEPASGIMGMGFQQLATSGATPFWEVLAKSDVLTTPAFTFQLARNRDASATTQSPGGIFTLGEIDSAQYSGDITYIDILDTTVGQRGYWAIIMDSLSVQGTSISTSGQYAAIDTGTTLIGAPSDVVESVYSAIEGSQVVTSGGQTSGYYAYPCSTTISISLTFGGRAFTMNSEDFNGGALGSGFCLGAIFEANLGNAGLSWVVGDAFLKNVFTVFESTPARVGFADLVGTSAQELDTNDIVDVASATEVTATSTGVGIPTATTTAFGALNSGIVGGSGLPNPVASGGVASSTAASPSSSTLLASVSSSSDSLVVIAASSTIASTSISTTPRRITTTTAQASITSDASSSAVTDLKYQTTMAALLCSSALAMLTGALLVI